mgnify:CR=1 FL=1|tara:strand:+ start:2378 stop:2800 length:423 start_codon:yes stop_codon:yes gene_type:complete
MIKFKLTCKECSKTFDSWFASSKEFEKLKKLKYVNCINCNSSSIEKSLMAPNVLNSKKKTIKSNNKFNEVRKKIREYQKFVEKNFKYVGNNFTYEARSIHYNKNKNKKGIYGNASLEEIKDLKEEGIETEVIPWIKDNEN